MNLQIGEFSPEELADMYGTPLLVVDVSKVKERIEEFKLHLKEIPHLLCYSVKANPIPGLLKEISDTVLLEASSPGELLVSLKASKPDRIVLDGFKDSDLITAAMKLNVFLLNSDSIQELSEIGKMKMDLDFQVETIFGIRVSLGLKGESGIVSTSTLEDKFGVVPEQIRDALRISNEFGLELKCIHTHIGSQIERPGTYREVVERMFSLPHSEEFDLFDLGGGFGIRYSKTVPSLEAFLGELSDAYLEISDRVGFCPKIILEPGRSIVGESGYFISREKTRKKKGRVEWSIVDLSTNHLLERLYLFRTYPSWNEGNEVKIGGPLCFSGDELGVGRVSNGLLVLKNCGAYTISKSSQYNLYPRPKVILVDGYKSWEIKEGESYLKVLNDFGAD